MVVAANVASRLLPVNVKLPALVARFVNAWFPTELKTGPKADCMLYAAKDGSDSARRLATVVSSKNETTLLVVSTKIKLKSLIIPLPTPEIVTVLVDATSGPQISRVPQATRVVVSVTCVNVRVLSLNAVPLKLPEPVVLKVKVMGVAPARPARASVAQMIAFMLGKAQSGGAFFEQS